MHRNTFAVPKKETEENSQVHLSPSLSPVITINEDAYQTPSPKAPPFSPIASTVFEVCAMILCSYLHSQIIIITCFAYVLKDTDLQKVEDAIFQSVLSASQAERSP